MRESVGGVVAILQVLGYKTEEQGRRGKVRDLFLFTSPTCEKRAICDRLSDAIGIVHAMSCHGTVTAVFGCFRPFQVPITPSYRFISSCLVAGNE